jgi:hypothetical protein
MVDFKPDSDSFESPEDLMLDLAKDGTSNDINRYQQFAGDNTNLLGDGVPGPETVHLGGTDDEIAHDIEAEQDVNQGPYSMVPSPKLIPD